MPDSVERRIVVGFNNEASYLWQVLVDKEEVEHGGRVVESGGAAKDAMALVAARANTPYVGQLNDISNRSIGVLPHSTSTSSAAQRQRARSQQRPGRTALAATGGSNPASSNNPPACAAHIAAPKPANSCLAFARITSATLIKKPAGSYSPLGSDLEGASSIQKVKA
jgi:hypothetical protein